MRLRTCGLDQKGVTVEPGGVKDRMAARRTKKTAEAVPSKKELCRTISAGRRTQLEIEEYQSVNCSNLKPDSAFPVSKFTICWHEEVSLTP
ncbi:UNVERIFIED_CONTAM: hypothetical protein K2H54_064365 [Gekko kuhli]